MVEAENMFYQNQHTLRSLVGQSLADAISSAEDAEERSHFSNAPARFVELFWG
jgi:hypothetical protein